MNELEVLDELGAAPDGHLRLNQLAEGLGMSASGLSRLVDRFEGEGLVERQTCPTDRRGFHVILTAAGTERQLEAERCRAEALDRILGTLPEGQLASLALALESVAGG